MNKISEYIDKVRNIISQVENEEHEKIEEGARLIADLIGNDGMIYAFGTGHSHMLVEELFYRAGGLVRVCPILDQPLMLHLSASESSNLEREKGYIDGLIDNLKDAKEGDIIFLFSNSGRNTVTIDMALLAKERGMKVISITSFSYLPTESRHEKGLKLAEVSDIAIDNWGELGDACIGVEDIFCGPTSSVIGCMIIQAMVCQAIGLLKEEKHDVEVWTSGNVDGGDDKNRKHLEKYKGKISCL